MCIFNAVMICKFGAVSTLDKCSAVFAFFVHFICVNACLRILKNLCQFASFVVFMEAVQFVTDVLCSNNSS